MSAASDRIMLEADVPTAPDTNMLPLFPTPVFVATIPEHETLNAEIKPIILEREKTDRTIPRLGNTGWQSSTDMYKWGGEAFQQVLRSILGIVDAATVGRLREVEKVYWNINCWANVNRNGDGNHNHLHPGSFWSAVYYIDDAGINDDLSLGGEFLMEDPRGAAPIMCEHNLTFPGEHGIAHGKLQPLLPRNGMVVIFPSWLSHSVTQYRGTGERISVSINFAVGKIKYRGFG